MTDNLVDHVRTLRIFAENTAMTPALRRAIEDTCNEVESLRVEAYEAWRRDGDAEGA